MIFWVLWVLGAQGLLGLQGMLGVVGVIRHGLVGVRACVRACVCSQAFCSRAFTYCLRVLASLRPTYFLSVEMSHWAASCADEGLDMFYELSWCDHFNHVVTSCSMVQ